MYRIAHALHFHDGHGQAQQQSPVKIRIDRFPQAHHIGVVGKLPAGLDIVGQIQYFFQQRHVGPAGGVVQNGLIHLVVHAVHMACDGCAGLGVQQLQRLLLQRVKPDAVLFTQRQLLRHAQLLGAVVEQGGHPGLGLVGPILPGQADGLLLLVNPWTPLPEDFLPGELVPVQNDQAVDARAYPDLQDMLQDMSQAGLSPLICSSYRSQERQQELYDNKVQRVMAEGASREAAQAEAARWVARPGTSEHQTGLAVDIVSLSNQMLDETQESTPEFQWLAENAWKYGFILRYPNDKSEKTGIAYEPWHFRFVGKEAAEEMHDLGLCLEEYLESLTD